MHFAGRLLNNVAKVLYCGKCRRRKTLVKKNFMNGDESADSYSKAMPNKPITNKLFHIPAIAFAILSPSIAALTIPPA